MSSRTACVVTGPTRKVKATVQATKNSAAALALRIAPIREGAMGVSLDNSARNRATSPGEVRPASVSATENKTMSLKFDIHPTANPTSDKDRAAKLVDPGFGR